jgi:toxin FitB
LNKGYLLDTNVLSDMMRPRVAIGVVQFLEATEASRLFISDINLAELKFGALLLPDPKRRDAILDAVNDRIHPAFSGRILSANEETWLIWKRIEYEGRKRRHTYPQPDLVIAALATQHALIVVTRDTEPFDKADVPVLNPWLS